jgi:predicted RNase H-like HicB family nuclease
MPPLEKNDWLRVSERRKMEALMDPRKIRKRPCARVLTPDADGQVTAEIMEFPGCVTFGDDAPSALTKLEEVASEWIAAAADKTFLNRWTALTTAENLFFE